MFGKLEPGEDLNRNFCLSNSGVDFYFGQELFDNSSGCLNHLILFFWGNEQ